MKRERICDALRIIHRERAFGIAPIRLAGEMDLLVIDADGFKNKILSPAGLLYRTGYVAGFLEGAGLAEMRVSNIGTIRASAKLFPTKKGEACLKKRDPR